SHRATSAASIPLAQSNWGILLCQGYNPAIRLHMDMDAFAALGDPTRRQLVQWLAVRPATATELSARLPVTRQAVVKHLGILEDARIVAKRRDGREVRYRIEAERLDAAAKWI